MTNSTVSKGLSGRKNRTEITEPPCPSEIVNYKDLNLKVVKKFGKGVHALPVLLLEGNGYQIVKKSYRKAHENIFNNEVNHLRKLHGCSFVPKLFSVDSENLTLYMSYCGPTVRDRKKLEKTSTAKEGIKRSLGYLS